MKEAIEYLVAAAFVALVVGAFWLHFFGPCSAFGWMTTKDIPARCLAEYANR